MSKMEIIMKIITPLLLLILTLYATNLFAITIETEAKFDTIYQYPIKVQESFGKLPYSGEFGIFLNITFKGVGSESDHESLFYRLKSGTVKDGKTLYTVIDGTKIILAEKKWYGWKLSDGVKIHYSMTRTIHPTFKVWVEVE